MALTAALLVLLAAGLVWLLWRGGPPVKPPEEEPQALVDRIDALLPQTQCGQCGFAGCRPYAEAIAAGEAEINRCAPGGQAGIEALAKLLDRPAMPLDPAYGLEKSGEVAFILEDQCIGCTKCIQVCPVDAIVGASKQMHTILADPCTGCGLCVPACPVDCIVMQPAPPGHPLA